MSEEIKRMSIKEFREKGFLQEANRQFFHPLGLALEVTVDDKDDDKEEFISGVWDYRDDPEGMVFGTPYGKDPDKIANVKRERERHRAVRQKLFGTKDIIEPELWSDSGESQIVTFFVRARNIQTGETRSYVSHDDPDSVWKIAVESYPPEEDWEINIHG